MYYLWLNHDWCNHSWGWRWSWVNAGNVVHSPAVCDSTFGSQLSFTLSDSREFQLTGRDRFWLFSFRGCSPWSLDPVALNLSWCRTSWWNNGVQAKQKDTVGWGFQYPADVHALLTWFPSSAPYLLKFLTIPRTPHAGGQLFVKWAFERHSCSKVWNSINMQYNLEGKWMDK